MTWINNLIEEYSSLKPLEVKLLKIEEKFLKKDYNEVVDDSKSLTESILKTILNERSIDFESSLDLEKLFNLFYKNINYFSQNEKPLYNRLRSSLINILNALREFRNCQGNSGHGKDLNHKETKEEIARFVFENSKNFVAFLWKIHKTYDDSNRNLIYEECQNFNTWFDEINTEDVKIKDYEYSFLPSQVLYLDLEAYRSEWNKFNLEIKDKEEINNLIKKLEESSNFAETDLIFEELDKKNIFDFRQIESIIKIILNDPEKEGKPWHYNQVRPKLLNNLYKSKDIEIFFQKLLKTKETITEEFLEKYLKENESTDI